MYSFATYDELEGRFVLKGTIPAQETLRAGRNSEPSFLNFLIGILPWKRHKKWRERSGKA